MIDTMIMTGSCPRCGTGTLTNDEDMFGVRIVCVVTTEISANFPSKSEILESWL